MPTLNDLLTQRIPPNSVEAERAVLGSVLLDRSGLALAIELLIAEDFYQDKHKKIFVVVLTLFERGDAVDVLTVTQELRAQGVLEDVQGPAYLAGLIEEAAVLAHLRSYIEIVREKAIAREMIRAATETIGLSYEGRRPVTEIMEVAERSLFRMADRQYIGTITTVGASLRDAFEYIERQAERQQVVTGLSSGLYELDLITSGFQRRDLILVGGRPSSGKTVFAMGVARTAANDGKRVLVFSLEMATQQLTLRLLSAEARVDNNKIRTGMLAASDWTRLVSAGGRLAEANLSIDDSATLTPLELRAKARRFKADGGLDLIVVDFLQLMSVAGRRENRQQEITTISRSLKAIAKEMDCPVVALSQLSRAVESREKKEPVISDLRESGAIEQDADLVLLLYRPSMYGLEIDGDSDSEIIIGKHRNGPIGRVKVAFIAEYSSFQTLSRRAESF
jgi:replicative DNA helicase